MKNILILTLLTLSILYAKPCMTDIYTGNGIMTNDASPSEAKANMIALKLHMLYEANSASRLDLQKYGTEYQFKYIHNPSYGFINDILETFYGLKETGQISDGYFTFILNITTGNLTIDEAVQKYRQIVSTYERDVSSIYNQYVASSFSKKHNVLLVAHSQGNIVGNKIFTKLTASQKKQFRMISVATPANSVAGDGPYVTVHVDHVIQLVPGALPSNVGGTGHNFITTYLDAHSNARNLIASYVKTAYNSFPCLKYWSVSMDFHSAGYMEIFGSPIINNINTLGRLPIGKVFFKTYPSIELKNPVRRVCNGYWLAWGAADFRETFGELELYNMHTMDDDPLGWKAGYMYSKEVVENRRDIHYTVRSKNKLTCIELKHDGELSDIALSIFEDD